MNEDDPLLTRMQPQGISAQLFGTSLEFEWADQAILILQYLASAMYEFREVDAKI